MLDFYLIGDQEPRNKNAQHRREYAGGIEENEFTAAQKANIIEPWQDYYGDFRWSNQQVKTKLEILENAPNTASYFGLAVILQKAAAANSGLIVFGD